jgi:2-dehydropantoate 2-reductase
VPFLFSGFVVLRPDLKIAVVGCGALGSYYGALFCRAGYKTHFLLRSDFETVRRYGVHIRSILGDFHVRPCCAREPEEIGQSDLVLIGLKSTANHQFSHLLPALIGEDTLLLTLQNGLGDEDRLSVLLSPEQILGGLCFVCLNRVEAGLVCHTAHGKVILGEYRRRPRARTEKLAARFQQVGVPCTVTEDLARAHWEKLVWNISFNGLGVVGSAGFEAVISGQVDPGRSLGPCMTTDLLLQDPRWANLVRELMGEVIQAAQGIGHPLDNELADRMIEKTRVMGAYKASTLIDFERNQALEMESLFTEPLRLAKSVGVDAPRLTALCQVLKALDPARSSRDAPVRRSA